MNKAVAIIEMPDCCCNCKILGDYGDCGLVEEYVDITKKHNNCPLRPYKDFIPIEWIKKFIEDNTFTAVNPKYDGCQFTEEPIDYCMKFRQYQVERMLAIWEKENENN